MPVDGTDEESEKPQKIAVSSNDVNKAPGEISERINIKSELNSKIATFQKMDNALNKGKPQLIDLSSFDIDQECKKAKARIRKLKKISREIDWKQWQLESPCNKPLVLLGTDVKPDEWEKVCNEAKKVWADYCKENGKKYLESPEGKLAFLLRPTIFCCNQIKDIKQEILVLLERVDTNNMLIHKKEQQLNKALVKLEKELIKKWNKIEKLSDNSIPFPNFKKYIQSRIIAGCKTLCWPNKDDYRDKYAIAIGQELENYFKRSKDGLKLTDDQVFEFVLEIRDLVLNSSNISPLVDIAIEIDGLEADNNYLQEELGSKEKSFEKYKRKIGDAEKILDKEVGIICSNSIDLIDQDTMREKLGEYLDLSDIDISVIKRFNEIYCYSMSFLWLYAKWLRNVNNLELQSSTDYCNWFNSITKLIKSWDEERQLKDQEKQDFERLISLVWHFQHTSDLKKTTSKKIIHDIVAEINQREFKIEYSIASLLTLEQLKQLLKTENLIQNDKLILIKSYSITTALFKSKEDYYYFDPNSNFEEVHVISTDVLARLIFNAHFYTASKPSPLGFVLLSSGKEQKAKYPLQKDILDAINPALNPIRRYAHETSELTLATEIGSLESVQYFLDKKVDPNMATVDGSTPLMFAAYYGYLEIVKLLLRKGASSCVNAQNAYSGPNRSIIPIQTDQ